MQCTSPFLRPEFLSEAYRLMTDEGFDSVFSVTRSKKLRWRRDQGLTVRPVNFNPAERRRRQDWDGELVENGMFYFARRHLINRGLLQGESVIL